MTQGNKLQLGVKLGDEWLNQNVNFSTTDVMSALITDVSKSVLETFPNPRLEEYKFVEVFLPFFAGKPEEEQKYRVNLGNWATVAGNPFNEVDVIDRQGKVLFTVPPIYDRMAIKPEADRQQDSIVDIVRKMQLLQQQSPRMAKQYYDSTLSQRAQSLFHPDNVLKHLRMWNDIFKRYGLPPILALEEEPSATDQTTPTTQANANNGLPTNDDDWELL